VATLNRTLKSFLFAIVGAEYVLRWLPRGTHRWRRFVRPGEVYRALARSGLDTVTVAGMRYDPLAGGWHRDADTRVNYMLLARRPTAPTITSLAGGA
jgi:2-polyprenyl-6-hydroxyphenyl methylase/3-demethylubiquinone-9 3-methyltransferase